MTHRSALLRASVAMLMISVIAGCQSTFELGPPKSDWRKVAAADAIISATLLETRGALKGDEEFWRVVEFRNPTSLKGDLPRYAHLNRKDHPGPLNSNQRYIIYVQHSDDGESYIERMDALPGRPSESTEAVRHDVVEQEAWVAAYSKTASADDWIVRRVRMIVARMQADLNANAALGELILMGPMAIPAIIQVMWELRDAPLFEERVSLWIPGGPWAWEGIMHYSATHPVDVLSLVLLEVGGESFGGRLLNGASPAIRQNIIHAWLVYVSYYQREAATDRWNLVRRPRLLSESERRAYVSMTHGFAGALERFDIAAHPELVVKLDEVTKKYLSGFFPEKTESELSDGDKSRLGYQRKTIVREYVLELVMQGRENIDR